MCCGKKKKKVLICLDLFFFSFVLFSSATTDEESVFKNTRNVISPLGASLKLNSMFYDVTKVDFVFIAKQNTHTTQQR